MGFIQDLMPVFKKSILTFIKKEHEIDNIYSFYFERNEPRVWKAGQHGIFAFSQKLKGGSWRGFSVASHPGEGVVRIATRIQENPSSFKQALMALKPGDKMTLRGPFGPFYLDGSRKPVVLISAGIGITPYRSMILDNAQHPNQAQQNIRLLYADNSDQYPFRLELEVVANKGSFLQTEYLTNDSLANKLSELINELGNNAGYYISGSRKMVKKVKLSLKQQGIHGMNIHHEIFWRL